MARQATKRANAHYWRFRVGAVLRGANGRLYAGCNVENAACPEGWCAEASAIAAIAMDGGRRIVEAAMMGKGAALVRLCGGCRQRLREFAADSLPIHICGPAGLRRTVMLGELLPLSFGPDNLSASTDASSDEAPDDPPGSDGSPPRPPGVKDAAFRSPLRPMQARRCGT